MFLRSCILPFALAALAAVPAPARGGTAWDLEILPLKPDVYLLRRPDPLRQPVEGNVLVIVNADDVVVFDGGGLPLAAENAIRLIRSVTPKPVRYLVNSHWHGDHSLGNQAYREAFPGVTIVGHPKTREAMLGPPMSYVGRATAELAPLIEEWSALAAKGELPERRSILLEDLKLNREDAKRIRITPPDLTVADELVLHRGDREIRVRHLGRGNTEGDLVLWLPKERILATGDLVVHPVPYGFGSFPREWAGALREIAAYPFEILVPGHGDLQRDASYVELLADMLSALREQAATAVAAGKDLEATRSALDFSAFRSRFPGDERGAVLFDAWWVSPIGRSLWLEASGLPITQAGADEND
jgi:glyoxylase-like metal-dependent hydrolase (beta-lactamase superfamily II)